jgi:signal transduction histidine kinase
MTGRQQQSPARIGRRRQLQAMATIGGVLLVTVVIFAIVYFFTGFIYQATGQPPPPFVANLINWVVGLLCCVAFFGTVGYLSRDRQWAEQLGVFKPIFDAMQRISQGDFNIQIENPYENNPLIIELTKNVNHMALELNQMEQMRQEFISNVSHELQSPLTAIRGFAQVLQNDQVSPAERHQYLAIIETESTRLSRLTDNLLKLAALDAEQSAVEPRSYRLDKQIRNLVLACEPQWAGKGLDLAVALDEVTIQADEDLLSQVWINLIHNSIKFTPDGGRLTLTLHQSGDQIRLTITDTGIGIAPDDQIHIFERFYKADKARSHATNSGSGLGLAIARKIVQLHHGTITVDSQHGQGTTFTVTLPAAQPQE